MDDDDLGDLSAVMGDDYGHGYDDSDGDPNVKPKKAAAPSVQDASKVGQTFVTIRFKAQKQFLTKLVVQCVPVPLNAAADADPFAGFKTDKGGGRIVQPDDPVSATEAKFENLDPGSQYCFRLKCTNPAGSSTGAASKGFFTLPKTPPAPEFAYASAKSVSIKFPPQGAGITKLGIEMAVWCAEPFSADNKKKGLLTDTSKSIGLRTTGLVRNLHPGRPYVFRIHVTNRAGTTVGPASKPIKTLPKAPPAPREDTTLRTDTTIGLTWAPFGDSITKLSLQYGILNGKTTFENLKENGGREATMANPQEISSYTVKRLEPDKNYVFRLIAKNVSGKSVGQILGPIKTITFTPDMLDKSGWLEEVPSNTKKTLKRRLSSSKGKMKKFFYTIDGKLFSWAAEPQGEEVNFLHLGKVAEVTLQGNVIELKLKSKDPKKQESLTLLGTSDDPNITSEQMMELWKNALIKAITGHAAVAEELKEASKVKKTAAIQADELSDDELEDDIGAAKPTGPADEEEEDAGGFGGADEEDEEETGGFDFDEGDEFEESEDEDDAGGFGDASESEEEEAGGFGF